MIVLALVGGIAAGAFAKAIGGVFLGEPRTQEAADAQPAPLSMDLPPFIFTMLSLALVFFAGTVCKYLVPVLPEALALPKDSLVRPAAELSGLVCKLSTSTLILCGIFAVLLILRGILLRNREITVRGTWDCGYAAPDARMEYTGTAFTQPLSDFFHRLTGWKKEVQPPRGYFPAEASIRITTADPAVRRIWAPVFRVFGAAAVKVRILQSGLLHFYILIMAAALLLMLAWGYFFNGSAADTAKIPASKQTKEVPR
jgi:hypothetical protein